MSKLSYITGPTKRRPFPYVRCLLGSLICLALLPSITLAQFMPVHDLLPPPAETEEGAITIEEQLVFIRGSNGHDKIVVKIREGRIRYEINGETSSLRDDDYPSSPVTMGPEMTRAAIVIAGYDGDDDIVIIDEIDEIDELDELGRISFVILGGPGNDRLVSDSMIESCVMIGGEGSDELVSGFGETTLSGGIMSCPSLNTLLFAVHYPDFEKDFLFGGGHYTEMYSQWFRRYEAVEAPSNLHQVVGNRHLEPAYKVSIVSREEGGFDVAPPAVYEDIRIEMDEVWIKGNTMNNAVIVNQWMHPIDSFVID